MFERVRQKETLKLINDRRDVESIALTHDICTKMIELKGVHREEQIGALAPLAFYLDNYLIHYTKKNHNINIFKSKKYFAPPLKKFLRMPLIELYNGKSE